MTLADPGPPKVVPNRHTPAAPKLLSAVSRTSPLPATPDPVEQRGSAAVRSGFCTRSRTSALPCTNHSLAAARAWPRILFQLNPANEAANWFGQVKMRTTGKAALVAVLHATGLSKAK